MSAIDTFRRAMRRHEKRARKMGRRVVADILRGIRLRNGDDSYHLAGMIKSRRANKLDGNRQAAFLYERAADAVARLRDGLRREEEQAEDEQVYCCADCFCIGAEPHERWCPEWAREQDAVYGRDDDGTDYHDPLNECVACGSADVPCDCPSSANAYDDYDAGHAP